MRNLNYDIERVLSDAINAPTALAWDSKFYTFIVIRLDGPDFARIQRSDPERIIGIYRLASGQAPRDLRALIHDDMLYAMMRRPRRDI